MRIRLDARALILTVDGRCLNDRRARRHVTVGALPRLAGAPVALVDFSLTRSLRFGVVGCWVCFTGRSHRAIFMAIELLRQLLETRRPY